MRSGDWYDVPSRIAVSNLPRVWRPRARRVTLTWNMGKHVYRTSSAHRARSRPFAALSASTNSCDHAIGLGCPRDWCQNQDLICPAPGPHP